MKHAFAAFWLAFLAVAAASAQPIHAVTEASAYTYVVDGKVKGSATEVVERTLDLAGLLDYTVNLYPWARAYDMALKDPNVLIFLIARIPARETQFQWAGEILRIQSHLYRLKSHALDIDNLESAKAYTICVTREDVHQQYLRSKGFDRLVNSAQDLDNFQKLLRGQVDLIPLTSDSAAALCRQTGFDCTKLVRAIALEETSTGIYMAYSLQTSADIVRRTRAAFKQLKSEGQVQRIMKRTLQSH